jgi:glycosyltransferase involved in cell wall biosynthesis
MGGGMILHRHFSGDSSYVLGIVTNNPSVPTCGDFYRYVPEPRFLSRLKKTRFSRWFHDYTHLVHSRIPDTRLKIAVEEFKPDVILNVAETYLSNHALLLARRAKIPFACYFMDWANYAACSHPWAVPLMDRMYRRLYCEADLALCISEGMREELGPHHNAQVVHPIGGWQTECNVSKSMESTRFTFCFAGNLAHWYGQQIEGIIRLCEGQDAVGLKIFGMHQNWTQEFEVRQRQIGVFQGYRPYEDLVPEFQRSDAFLLPMGFDPEAALIERTSFKTKFLDYLGFGKPILVWGPEYCTAVRSARQYESALCITDPNPEAAYAGMRRIATEPDLRVELIRNATRMRQAEFHPDRVLATLRHAIENLIALSKK